jgi:hypothetical protein
LCAYLSVIALAGLGINAIWHLRWADPVAALVILPVMIWEGREALRLLLISHSRLPNVEHLLQSRETENGIKVSF